MSRGCAGQSVHVLRALSLGDHVRGVRESPERYTISLLFYALPPSSTCSDLEWKLTYVGAPDTESYDQELDSVLVGPVPEGRHKFVFEVGRVH